MQIPWGVHTEVPAEGIVSGDPAGVGGGVDIRVRLGLLYPYVGNTAVYKCPADTFGINSFGSFYVHVRSISTNMWLAPIAPWNNTATVVSYCEESSLIKPDSANLWVFIDENPTGINDGSFVCDPNRGVWDDLPAYYHNNAGGIAFADGHAEIRRWHDPAVLGPVTQSSPGVNQPKPPGEIPPADLVYLQKASTVIK
jgi:prepilin-type processing-associated H-X9-DG protein